MNTTIDGNTVESILPAIQARNAIAVFLIALGFFGNISFIAAVRGKKEIRNKHSILLSIMCTAQLVCLFFEALKQSKFAVAVTNTRESCFSVIFPYIITATYQSIGIFIVGLDILISLLAPVKYFNLRNFPYLLYLQVPCIATSALFPIYTLSLNEPDYLIPDCNPVLALKREVFMLWSWTNIVICFLVVFIYAAMVLIVLVSVIIARRKSASRCAEGVCTKYSANSQYQRRIVTSMVLFMGVFSFSWFLSNGAVHVSYLIPQLELSTLYTIYTYSLIPSLVCFSQSYYVHFAMSKDYRKAFLASGIFSFVQLGRKACERSSSSTISTSIETKPRVAI